LAPAWDNRTALLYIITNFGTHTPSEQKILEGYFEEEFLSLIAVVFYVP
jgi:hypothetical protein